MSDLRLQLQNHRLTTAEIIYRLPDFPELLQSYIWQEVDTPPRFPRLCHFLRFWAVNLEGSLHTVRVASTELIKPAEFRFLDGEFHLN